MGRNNVPPNTLEGALTRLRDHRRSGGKPTTLNRISAEFISWLRRDHLKITQEEFARRYRMPVGTLRGWEQGQRCPSAAEESFLLAIYHNPDGIQASIWSASKALAEKDMAMEDA